MLYWLLRLLLWTMLRVLPIIWPLTNPACLPPPPCSTQNYYSTSIGHESLSFTFSWVSFDSERCPDAPTVHYPATFYNVLSCDLLGLNRPRRDRLLLYYLKLPSCLAPSPAKAENYFPSITRLCLDITRLRFFHQIKGGSTWIRSRPRARLR